MVGKNLSHYRIIEELGRGGMGIVYRAEDTNLDRLVAIKLLPSAALASEDDRARFYREAKAAAALNHPNIAAVHQIAEAVPSDAPHGTEPSPFIAMEYIDGEPLDERIKRGPLKLTEAVRIATQIAGALGEAHENGIVHRDVKPSNIMLTSKGDTRILDFGLALTAASTKLTRLGSTVGTIGYMSPEQTRGEEVDRRTDIWSLGVVMYEMITGQHPFKGDYEQAVVYSILNETPDPPTALRTGVPMELERIIDKCLSKDARSRYQSVTDLLVDLERYKSGLSTVSSRSNAADSGPATSRGQQAPADYGRRIVLITGALLLLAVAYILGATRDTDVTGSGTIRIDKTFGDLAFISYGAWSEDGRYLVLSTVDDRGLYGIRVYDVKTGTSDQIETDGLSNFSISPDSRRIAFSSSDRCYVSQLPNNSPDRITENCRAPAWINSDDFVFVRDDELYRVSRRDKSPTLFVRSDTIKFVYPSATLDENRYVLVEAHTMSDQNLGILIVDLESPGEYKMFKPGARWAYPLGSEFVTYIRVGEETDRVWAEKLTSSGHALDGFPIDLDVDANGGTWTSSALGHAAYVSTFIEDARSYPVVDVDVDGNTTRAVAARRTYTDMALSPDGRILALEVLNPIELTADIELLDLNTGAAPRRITYTGFSNDPAWDSSGDFLYYVSRTGSVPDIFTIVRRRITDLVGDEDLVVRNGQNPDLSADGRFMLYDDVVRGGIFELDLESGETRPVDTTAVLSSEPDYSPDGRYVSFEAVRNRVFQVFVVSTSGGTPETITPGGFGRDPAWSRDGEYIYYNGETSLERVPIQLEPEFSVTGPAETVLPEHNPMNEFVLKPDGTGLYTFDNPDGDIWKNRLYLILNLDQEVRDKMSER